MEMAQLIVRIMTMSPTRCRPQMPIIQMVPPQMTRYAICNAQAPLPDNGRFMMVLGQRDGSFPLPVTALANGPISMIQMAYVFRSLDQMIRPRCRLWTHLNAALTRVRPILIFHPAERHVLQHGLSAQPVRKCFT